jgi:hypothetical protein
MDSGKPTSTSFDLNKCFFADRCGSIKVDDVLQIAAPSGSRSTSSTVTAHGESDSSP